MGLDVTRRQFLLDGFGLASVTLLSGCGQLPRLTQTASSPIRIGFLVSTTGPYIGTPAAVYEAFGRGLRELGYVVGTDITIEYRSAEDRSELSELAAELLGLHVELVVAAGVASFAAQSISDAIPVVFGFSGDPVEAGFVDSLARPGRNMTGMTFLGDELVGKRLQFLKQTAPRITRVAILAFPGHPGQQREWENTQLAAQALGVSVALFEVTNSDDVENALQAITADLPDALLAFPDSITLAHRERMAEFAIENRLPSVFGWKQYAEAGGLLSYGPNLEDSWGRIAVYVDRLLKGAKPATLPVERPRKFELIVNLKTAQAIGLSIPQDILTQANAFIQ